MIENLIEFCAKNRFIVFLLVSGLAIGGLWVMRQTPVDALPDLSDTQVIIQCR
jgi:Cu(I)/Ag(I) efflux system membrane protein CusA/SilA